MNKTNLSSVCKLEKGVEIGSKNYIEKSKEGLIHYLRVGNLDNLSSTYIEENISKNMALEDDILIAFDGALGRNSIGISGAFSSEIYKIICDKTNKGLVYFQINSLLNQKIISDHSQGTTILHASKAIPYLQCCICFEKDINFFNNLFIRTVSFKKKITTLKIVKKQLLLKYF